MGSLISWADWSKKQRKTAKTRDFASSESNDPNIGLAQKPNDEVKTAIQLINEANSDILTEIKGVGPKTIENLVKNRPFSNFTDMKNRSKVSARAFSSLQNWAESKNCALQQEKVQ